MERKYLEMMTKKLQQLNEKEVELRNKYLKKMGRGEIEGPQTGYPSIDKPQLRFYRDEVEKELNPNQLMYDMIFDQEDMNAEAIGFLGTTWTFKKLKEETDKCADMFNKMGLKEGDVLLVGVSNSPETLVTLLAANKLGIVSKWFDIRANEKDIIYYANSNNCKYMVAFDVDVILPKVKKALEHTNLEKVLVMSPVSTLNKAVKVLYEIKTKKNGTYVEIPNDERYEKFDKFVKKGDSNSKVEKVKFSKEKPAIMIQSSGTTGKPKTITHSNYSVTNGVIGMANTDLPVRSNSKVLIALPPWIAYCIGTSVAYTLSMGGKVELCEDFEPDAVYKNIGKFSMAFAAPFHYRYIKEHYNELSEKKKHQLASVDCLVTGGDKVTVEENGEWEKLFKVPVVNGYGNNEGWGCLTVNPMKHNKYGTVGIAKYGDTLISYDNDKKEELPYNEIGEICALTDTMFLGYEDNPIETAEVKKVHPIDGKVWIHTGDLGYIDNEGFVHLKGRARRVITRMGFKISAYTIEDKISSNPYVKECVAVAVKDQKEEHVPMAFVVIKEGLENNIEEIKQSINKTCKELKDYEIPKYLKIVPELPYTPNNKYDFVKLEQIGNEYVNSISSMKLERRKK